MSDIPLTCTLSFNGEAVTAPHSTLQALLEARRCDLTSAMACAVNSQFVPRPRWATHRLKPGDRVDVVVPVTGG